MTEAHEPNATTGSFMLPTMTGGIPVLEDAAHQQELPHLGERKAQVTGLVIAVLTTLSAIGPLATDMYIPAFPQVTADLATDAARMQLTLTAFFVGTAVGQIVSGPLSDRFGRRLPLLFGIVLTLLGSVGCAIAPTASFLLMARVLQGVGGGFGMVLGRAVLIDLARGPELFKTLNIMQGISGVAPIVAPLMGGLILAFEGGHWRIVFWLIAAMSLVSLVGVVLLIPETLAPEHRHAGGFRAFVGNTVALLTRPAFTSYMLVNAFSAFALMAYVSASSFVVQSMLGFSATQYSLSFAINSTGMMTMSFVSARLAQSVAPRALARVGLTVAATAVVALVIGSVFLGTPAWIVFPGFFFLVASQGLIFGNAGALASREALDFAGTASALLGLGFSFAAALSAPLVGLGGTHSSHAMAFTMLGGVTISLICFVVAGRARSHAPDHP